MDLNLNKPWELVMHREAWDGAVHGSQRVWHDWVTELPELKTEYFLSAATMENSTCACSVTQSCPTLCNPVNCSPPGSSTGVGFHLLLQGVFPTQELKPTSPVSPTLEVDSLPLSHLGSPKEQYEASLEKLKLELPYDPEIVHSWVYTWRKP